MVRKKKYTLEVRVRLIEEKKGVIQEDVKYCTIGDVMRLSNGRYESTDEEQRMDMDRIKRVMDDFMH